MTSGVKYPDGAECMIDWKPNGEGKLRIAWKTACMPASAFEYVKTEAQARGFKLAFELLHDGLPPIAKDEGKA